MQSPAETRSLLRLIDWIWHIRGEVPLPPGQSVDEAFARLDPLFTHAGTVHARMGETLVMTKQDPLAQDPLSVVDSGTLRIAAAGEGAVLRYHLVSRVLLYCFFAPLLFLAVGQLTAALGKLEKPPVEEQADKKKDKKAELKLNPVDQFLGAPAPEKPKDEKKDAKSKKDGDKKAGEEKEKDKFSPTPAYVFAGIFAALWLLGRLLEPWLIRRLFARKLAE